MKKFLLIIALAFSFSGCAIELSTAKKVVKKSLDVAARAGEVATAIKTVKQSQSTLKK